MSIRTDLFFGHPRRVSINLVFPFQLSAFQGFSLCLRASCAFLRPISSCPLAAKRRRTRKNEEPSDGGMGIGSISVKSCDPRSKDRDRKDAEPELTTDASDNRFLAQQSRNQRGRRSVTGDPGIASPRLALLGCHGCHG
jgi:hypothetical protein